MDKEIKERIKSIISVLVFLIVTTWYWYGPREDLGYISTNLNGLVSKNELDIIGAEDIKLDNNEYNFTIRNKTNHQVNYEIIISNDYYEQRSKNCDLLGNNYLAYQLKTNGYDNKLSNLSVDGIIYRGLLESKEVRDFTLKIRVDKNDISSFECFYPIVSASTYYKI